MSSSDDKKLEEYNALAQDNHLTSKFQGEARMRRLATLISMLGIFNYAHAVSISTDAVYNGSWSGVIVGTPGPNENNTFNSSGIPPALTVIGGVSAFLDHSTNIFNGDISAQSDITGNSSLFLDNSINTVTGNIYIQNGNLINLSTSTNSISGNVVVDGGYATLASSGIGSSTNTINNLCVWNGGIANLSNTGSGTVTNTINNAVRVTSGSVADFSNSGSGNTSNTITTISNAGTLYLGGSGGTTHITNMNLTDGEFAILSSTLGS